MIIGDKYRGKRLNCFSKIICDKCGCDCSKEFFEIFINNYIEISSTASNPFEQIKTINKQFCKDCINNFEFYNLD